jgi:predicted RNA-binding protein YlxR (DUF448 family)
MYVRLVHDTAPRADSESRIVLDFLQTSAGRGHYICGEDCVTKLSKRLLCRVFRTNFSSVFVDSLIKNLLAKEL